MRTAQAPDVARYAPTLTTTRRFSARPSLVGFDAAGAEHRQHTRFDMTWLFPRELRLLVERHGLAVEHLFGNYDGSPLKADSPRMIARCCRP